MTMPVTSVLGPHSGRLCFPAACRNQSYQPEQSDGLGSILAAAVKIPCIRQSASRSGPLAEDTRSLNQQSTTQGSSTQHGAVAEVAMFQAVRALMIVGIVLAAIGLLIAIFSLKCIRIGSMEDSSKAKITLTSGIMFILAGLCAIIGVSIFANMLVTNFWMSTANMYSGGAISGMGGMGGMQTLQTRYTFGAALFVGWVAGGLTMVGGVMMCLACRGLTPEDTHYKSVAYHVSGKNSGYKTAGYKSSAAYTTEEKSKKSIYNESRRSDDGKSYPSKYDYV